MGPPTDVCSVSIRLMNDCFHFLILFSGNFYVIDLSTEVMDISNTESETQEAFLYLHFGENQRHEQCQHYLF